VVGKSRGLILRYYPAISLEGQRKNTKKPQTGERVPGPEFELGTSEHEAGVPTMTFGPLYYKLQT
jgi:hypothetical protein